VRKGRNTFAIPRREDHHHHHHHHLYEEEEDNNNIILIMGQTVYHGVAKNVYVAKEALIGLALGVVAGCGWKYSHWQRRGEIERYYEKMPKN
tara:strand:+ start:308 stop:583 length:276 start_codon:yes stop_codon:yes gene_type:complete